MITYRTNAMVVQQYKDRVKVVMANSTLDSGQKHRFSKRLGADLDFHIATHNSHLVNKKIESASGRILECKEQAQRADYWEKFQDLKGQRIIIDREVTRFRWMACKLYLSVPLGEVSLSERGARIIGQIWHEILAPLGRFLGRFLGRVLFWIFLLPSKLLVRGAQGMGHRSDRFPTTKNALANVTGASGV
jgi:hypothetical protein